MATWTLSGDLGDLLGGVHVTPAGMRTKAFVHPYGGSVVSGGDVLMGSLELDLDDDDAFLVVIPQGGYQVTAVYYNPASRVMRTFESGWFNLTANGDLATLMPPPGSTAPPPGVTAADITAVLALGTTNDAMIGSRVDLGGSATDIALRKKYPFIFAPKAYGAVGNDSTDDRTALNSTMTAASAALGIVDLGGLTYRVTDSVTVPANVTVRNGKIHTTGTGKTILNVTGDNVTIRDVELIGRHATATAANLEQGIVATGASAAAPLKNLTIHNVQIRHLGMYGVMLTDVEGFDIRGCYVHDIGYTGIGILSGGNGTIDSNRVINVLGDTLFSFDGYGIAISRSQEIDSLVTSPKPKNIVVSNNVVQTVPWEGIDTHGGERITIAGNAVTGCKTGIAVVGADGTAGTPLYAAQHVTVSGNVIDSGVTNGTAGPGITFVGAPGASSSVVALEYATGAIIGNTVRNHGNESDATVGAIWLRNTKGVTVSGNHMESPAPWGICLYYDNRGVSVSGNTVVDGWSNTFTTPGFLAGRSDNNTGAIIGNALSRGSKTATTVNNRGIYNSGSGSDFIGVSTTLNHLSAATTPV